MQDGNEFCFVGKYTRLINTLSSFISNVQPDLSSNDKISNRILQLRANKNPPLSHDTIKNIICLCYCR